MITVRDIPISQITFLDNSRLRIEEKDLSELMADIKSRGLLQPIGTFFDEKSREHILIYGHRRVEAFKRLGLKTITSSCHEGEDFDFVKFISDNLAENIQRKDLQPIEIARVVKLLEEKGLNRSEISVTTGISKNRIDDCLNMMAHIPEKFKADVSYQRIPNSKIKTSISVKVSNAIMRRSHGVKQIEELFEYAKRSECSTADINLLKSLMSRGMSLDKAIKNLKNYVILNPRAIVVNKDELDKYQYSNTSEFVIRFINGEEKPNKNLVFDISDE